MVKFSRGIFDYAIIGALVVVVEAVVVGLEWKTMLPAMTVADVTIQCVGITVLLQAGGHVEGDGSCLLEGRNGRSWKMYGGKERQEEIL